MSTAVCVLAGSRLQLLHLGLLLRAGLSPSRLPMGATHGYGPLPPACRSSSSRAAGSRPQTAAAAVGLLTGSPVTPTGHKSRSAHACMLLLVLEKAVEFT